MTLCVWAHVDHSPGCPNKECPLEDSRSRAKAQPDPPTSCENNTDPASRGAMSGAENTTPQPVIALSGSPAGLRPVAPKVIDLTPPQGSRGMHFPYTGRTSRHTHHRMHAQRRSGLPKGYVRRETYTQWPVLTLSGSFVNDVPRFLRCRSHDARS